MTEDLTAEQEKKLDEIARIDKWEEEPYTRESLGRRVRAKMYEGLNFGRAVVAVLADVPREDDPSALRKKEQIAAQQKLIDLGKMREAIRRKLQKSLTLMPANSRTIKISSPIQSSEIVGTKPPIVS